MPDLLIQLWGATKKKLDIKTLSSITQRIKTNNGNQTGDTWSISSARRPFYCHLRHQVWNSDLTRRSRLTGGHHGGDWRSWAVLWILHAGLRFLGDSRWFQLCGSWIVGPTEWDPRWNVTPAVFGICHTGLKLPGGGKCGDFLLSDEEEKTNDKGGERRRKRSSCRKWEGD